MDPVSGLVAFGVNFIDADVYGKSAIQLIDQYFANNRDEVEAAVLGKQYNSCNYRHRLLLGIIEQGALLSVAIVLPRSLHGEGNGQKTMELTWFATHREYTKLGLGNRLFEAILSYSKLSKCVGLLITSTNHALPYWISRANHFVHDRWVLCPYILRAPNRGDILSIDLSNDVEENKKIRGKLKQDFAKHRLKVLPFPNNPAMEKLYQDTVFRNRKGVPNKSQVFKGHPYRYDIESSNHLWYLFSPKLIKQIGVDLNGRDDRSEKSAVTELVGESSMSISS